MALINGIPVTHRPTTLCDSPDGTNAAPGAMASLANLIPSRTGRGIFICRPAAVPLTNFLGFTTPGFISAELVVGDTMFGMIATGRNAGHDEPFAYDLINNVFLTVAGVTSGNVPVSPPSTGDWTPPTMAQVGTRIVVTHPGFPGDSGSEDTSLNFVKVGWFDISSFKQDIEVDLVSGSVFVYGGLGIVTGVQPGMTLTLSAQLPAGAVVVRTFPATQSVARITGDSHGTTLVDNIPVPGNQELVVGHSVLGPGVQPGTTIISLTGSSMTLSQPTLSTVAGGSFLIYGNGYPNHGDFTVGSAAILNADTHDLHVGQLLSGASIPANTYILNISGTTVNMSQSAAGTGTSVAFTSTGAVIEMNLPATGSTTGPIRVSGGSPTAPLWDAGDATPAGNVLPSVPVGVAQGNGRAWYACGLDGIVYSDSLLAQVVSNSSVIQAIKLFDGRPITAIAPLMLSTPLTGGIVQAIIAFQSTYGMIQIKGDQATNDLTVNGLPVATGTLAPNSIDVCKDGTYFVSPDGMRRIGFDGSVSDPIGQNGDGVVFPMMLCGTPTRIAICSDRDTIRVSVPGQTGTDPTFDFWYHLTTGQWSGPHTFASSICRGWRKTVISAPSGITGQLWQADLYPDADTIYIENGNRLQWTFAPTPLPDTGQIAMNALVEMMIAIELSAGTVATATARDINGDYLDLTTIEATASGPNWDAFNWGQAKWSSEGSIYRQRSIDWNVPLEFKQLLFSLTGASNGDVKVSNLYMRYQQLGYRLEDVSAPAPLASLTFLLANDGVTAIASNADAYLESG